MAKRFTDTNKYKKPFLRGLQGAYKLLWDYLYHECDHAGVWIVDFEIAQMYIGGDMKISKEKALSFFNPDEVRVVEIDNGKQWFLPGFIEFQYGKLNPKNRVHESVISILHKHNLIEEDFSLKQFKPLISPLQGAKDKDKEKDKLKDKDKDKKEVKVFEIIYPFNSESFMQMWGNWIQFKKDQHSFTYKSPISEQAALKDLAEISNGNEQDAIKFIEHAIKNGWKGIFKPKDFKNGSSEQSTGQTDLERAMAQQAIRKAQREADLQGSGKQ